MKHFRHYSSPLGTLLLAGENEILEELHFTTSNSKCPANENWRQDETVYARVVRQLDEYFAGKRTSFELELHPRGTMFQQRVWRELRNIPFGTTASYGEIAGRIGQPKACRAVGMANGRNPIPIIIPCHRVIGKDGSLTGFSSGLPLKRQLLAHEGITILR